MPAGVPEKPKVGSVHMQKGRREMARRRMRRGWRQNRSLIPREEARIAQERRCVRRQRPRQSEEGRDDYGVERDLRKSPRTVTE